MFVRLMRCGKDRKKVLLVEGYRDELGRSRQRRLRDYGYLDELLAKDADILEKLTREARELTAQSKEQVVTVTVDNTAPNSDSENFWWYTVEILSAVYESLGLNDLAKRHNNRRGYGYDLDQALRLFVFGRMLDPASKLATLRRSSHILRDCDLRKDDINRSLDEICRLDRKAQRRVHKRSKEIYGSDMTVVFYDVTNYYFEADLGDDFRKRGPSKENRKDDPLVAMGLLMDGQGMPVAYDIFSGNTHDSRTLIPFLAKLKGDFSFERMVVVADKGLNAKDNLVYLKDARCGYIVSETIRGASKNMKIWAKDAEGWTEGHDGKRYKSHLRAKKVVVADSDGKEREVTLEERVICVYSEKYRDRDRARREQVIELLRAYIDDPAKYRASIRKGSKKYLDVKEANPHTGEVDKDTVTVISLDEKKIAEDAALDGYYCVATSEVGMAVPEVLERYSGLWRIEESFRVIKGELEGRPIFVRNEQHIRAHFLICFIALAIGRIIQKRCGFLLSAERTLEALRQARCHHLGSGLYHIEPQSDDLKEIFRAFATDLDKARASITDIREFGRRARAAAKIWENTTETVS